MLHQAMHSMSSQYWQAPAYSHLQRPACCFVVAGSASSSVASDPAAGAASASSLTTQRSYAPQQHLELLAGL
jgi:hypothetical protein